MEEREFVEEDMEDHWDAGVVRGIPFLTVSPLETATELWDCQIPALRNLLWRQVCSRAASHYDEIHHRLHSFVQSLFSRATVLHTANESAVAFTQDRVTHFHEQHQACLKITLSTLQSEYEEFKSKINDAATTAARQQAQRWEYVHLGTLSVALRNNGRAHHLNLARQLVAPMEAAITHKWLRFFIHFMKRLLEGYNRSIEVALAGLDTEFDQSSYKGFAPSQRVRQEISVNINARLNFIYRQVRHRQANIKDLEVLIDRHMQYAYEQAGAATEAEMLAIWNSSMSQSQPLEALSNELINQHVSSVIEGVVTSLEEMPGFVLEQVSARYIPKLNSTARRSDAEEQFASVLYPLISNMFSDALSDVQLESMRQQLKDAGYREPASGPLYCCVCDLGEGDPERPCDFLCSPCGHPVCSICYPKIRILDGTEHRRCPICRTPILAHVRVPGIALRVQADDDNQSQSFESSHELMARYVEQHAGLLASLMGSSTLASYLFRFNGNIERITAMLSESL
eukprot:NODE_767_length_1918_cov_37.622258_g711_i0.p1 GENE.NODE_767_length_1918_cov_37.622258_g711_i0~~NODE_767_length_1918_cov_37.622258_g711_i0.p1  ORF type:complete len:562 (+),score=104.18 NODE_767_length_1918_cov_37.622258_g711_i0:149-1687(+)